MLFLSMLMRSYRLSYFEDSDWYTLQLLRSFSKLLEFYDKIFL